MSWTFVNNNYIWHKQLVHRYLPSLRPPSMGHTLPKSFNFIVNRLDWMRNRHLLLSTFCTFQTPLTLLTNSTMIHDFCQIGRYPKSELEPGCRVSKRRGFIMQELIRVNPTAGGFPGSPAKWSSLFLWILTNGNRGVGVAEPRNTFASA